MEKTLWKNLQGILICYRWPLVRALLMVIIANGLLVFIPLVFRYAVMQMDSPWEQPQGMLHEAIYFILGNSMNSIYAWAILLLLLSLVAAYFKPKLRPKSRMSTAELDK